MALFCQNMLEIAVEMASRTRRTRTLAVKFVDHFLSIANAMNRVGHTGMWDEEDGFYYDVLRLSGRNRHATEGALDGRAAAAVRDDRRSRPWQRERVPRVEAHFRERVRRTPALFEGHPSDGARRARCGDRGIMAVVDEDRLRRILTTHAG